MSKAKAAADSQWRIVALEGSHNARTFDCGVEPLNVFIQKNVERNTKQHYGRTFVAEPLPVVKDRSITGYYTISMASISFSSIPEKPARSLPKYPVPAALIGRLAVDRNYAGRGLGACLLLDALKRIYALASTEIGCAAALVEAKDERARDFYLKFGFVSFADKPDHLFMMMKTIKKLFG